MPARFRRWSDPQVAAAGGLLRGLHDAEARGWSRSFRLLLDGLVEHITAELFTDPGNNAVVRLPPRRFPGVLIQGDSLSVIRAEVAEIMKACNRGEVSEAREAAALLLADLDDLLARYTTVLEDHGIARPY